MEQERAKAVGLKWPKRATERIPVWHASKAAKKAGYRPKCVDLKELADNPEALLGRCDTLQSQMLIWMRANGVSERVWDGSFKALLELYQIDPQSPYKTALKPGTVKVYTTYLGKLIPHIGGLYLVERDGRDVMEWFAEWRRGPDGKDQLPAACTVLAVLKAAVSFGIVCRKPGVKEFQDVLNELQFPKPRRRDQAPTADQIIAARLAAHKNGAPCRALLYALQFETTGRQWDFIGSWWPMSDPRISTVMNHKEKWFGPRWSDIDESLILNMKPTKTEDTSEVEITYDLAACPMVMEELANFPPGRRVGPLIINEWTGHPYRPTALVVGWHKDYDLAGISRKILNRDTRAGGITEGGLAKASRDDRRRLAGHTDERRTLDYERGTIDLEAHRSVMAARRQFREKNGK